jgi:antitoxin (DNA-binding transcriptional repressor) of toxin-antitoxin stability system
MNTLEIDVRELPARLAEIVELVKAGGEVVVTENAVPRVRLAPLPPMQPRIAGLHPGAITMTDDFDEPLPDEFWLGTL